MPTQSSAPIESNVVSLAKTIWLASFILCVLLAGCSNSDSTEDSAQSVAQEPPPVQLIQERDSETIRSAADMAATGQVPDVGSAPFSASKTPLPESAARQSDADQRTTDGGGTAPKPGDAPSPFELAEMTPAPVGIPNQPADPNERSLRDDLNADQLMKVLESSDQDMETIASGRAGVEDPEEASRMMRSIARIKLQASVRLQGHPDASEKQRIDGMRGHLQSLSHLAAMGDVASAEALEALATKNLSSDEPTIAGDSRIVLIGFAIDALQAGEESAADRLVKLIEAMQENPNSDLPAVLIMAQARQTLASYGLLDHAAKVRDKILALYGNSDNATIAKVAADAAGTAKYDAARRLLASILENDQVAVERWTDVTMELINDAPDMNTVQFLASSALQLEAVGRQEFVEETFAVLSEQFTDAESDTAKEIETAKQAMEARRDVIGTDFDFDLPSVDGEGVDASRYSGKVVLMPFWAVTFPESLQLVPMLKQIREAHPGQVEIVGMNLDPEQAPLAEFLAQGEMGFPSYRSASSATASVANPIAAKFGLVSLPFVAIFNQQGKVEALDFTGRQLESTVQQLVNADQSK